MIGPVGVVPSARHGHTRRGRLVTGAAGRPGGQHGVVVDAHQREVVEDELDLARAHVLFHDHRSHPQRELAAPGALEITELHHFHRGIRRAQPDRRRPVVQLPGAGDIQLHQLGGGRPASTHQGDPDGDDPADGDDPEHAVERPVPARRRLPFPLSLRHRSRSRLWCLDPRSTTGSWPARPAQDARLPAPVQGGDAGGHGTDTPARPGCVGLSAPAGVDPAAPPGGRGRGCGPAASRIRPRRGCGPHPRDPRDRRAR